MHDGTDGMAVACAENDGTLAHRRKAALEAMDRGDWSLSQALDDEDRRRRRAAVRAAQMAEAMPNVADDPEAMEAARLLMGLAKGKSPDFAPLRAPGDSLVVYLFTNDDDTPTIVDDADIPNVESLPVWATPTDAMAGGRFYPEGTRMVRARLVVEEVVRGPDAVERWAEIGNEEARWKRIYDPRLRSGAAQPV